MKYFIETEKIVEPGLGTVQKIVSFHKASLEEMYDHRVDMVDFYSDESKERCLCSANLILAWKTEVEKEPNPEKTRFPTEEIIEPSLYGFWVIPGSNGSSMFIRTHDEYEDLTGCIIL